MAKTAKNSGKRPRLTATEAQEGPIIKSGGRNRGRPRKIVDEKRVIELSSKGLTQEEIAALENVSVDTLTRNFAGALKRRRMPENRQKTGFPRQPANRQKTGSRKLRSGHSAGVGQPAATIPDQTPAQVNEQLASELKKTAFSLKSVPLRARPEDYPLKSMQSRAAARAMSLNRVESDPILAMVRNIPRDPMTPEIVVASAPALGPDGDWGEITAKPGKPVIAKPGSVNFAPETYTPDREKLRRAFEDVSRGFRGSQPGNAPMPGWAANR